MVWTCNATSRYCRMVAPEVARTGLILNVVSGRGLTCVYCILVRRSSHCGLQAAVLVTAVSTLRITTITATITTANTNTGASLMGVINYHAAFLLNCCPLIVAKYFLLFHIK